MWYPRARRRVRAFFVVPATAPMAKAALYTVVLATIATDQPKIIWGLGVYMYPTWDILQSARNIDLRRR